MKISAILCTCNDSRFLISWLERVIKARYDEVIIVDDCSTDETVELLKTLMEQGHVFRLFLNKNKGLYNATMLGVAEAKNEYVTLLATDDYPQGFYNLKMLEKDIICYSSFVIKENKQYLRRLFPFDAYVSPQYLEKIFRAGYGHKICMAAPIIKKEVIQKCWHGGGKYLTCNFDFMCNLYAMFNTGFLWLAEPKYTYRSYPNSYGFSGKSNEIKKSFKIIDNFMKESLPEEKYLMFKRSNVFKMQANQLSILNKLPKFIREMIYRKFYSYDWRIEKL